MERRRKQPGKASRLGRLRRPSTLEALRSRVRAIDLLDKIGLSALNPATSKQAESAKVVVAPDPSEEDKAALDAIVKKHLGEQATGSFIGAMAKGVKGDAAFYGHAVVITDPNIPRSNDGLQPYYERVGEVAQIIGNSIAVAANVTLDVTHYGDGNSAL